MTPLQQIEAAYATVAVRQWIERRFKRGAPINAYIVRAHVEHDYPSLKLAGRDYVMEYVDIKGRMK